MTIEVNVAAPTVTYSTSSSILTKGVAMTSITPTTGGGAVVSWSISPTLPAGLSFDSSNGAISGTPTAVSSSTAYTVTATNAGGSGTATVTIQVNDIPPSGITYSPSFLSLAKDAAMSTATPTSSGGTVTSWSISPTLPSGLSFDTSTGAISGTPTATSSATTYTVTASNSGGSATVTVTILVNDAAPSSVTYSPNSFTLTKDVAMTSVTPTASGGTATSWSISPSLPAGLTLDTSNGEISGTPTAVSSSTVYTVTASNAGGSSTATVTIQVNDVAPYSVSYSGTPFTLTKGTAMTAVTPSASGGAVDTWSISSTLPAGLSFDTSTGKISGTPTAISSSTTYTITATNTGGSTTTTVDITVNDVAPSIAYSGSPFTLTKGTTMTTAAPTSSGGTVVSWSVSPTLPAGLTFDTSNGEISGTPTAITSSATYTITATNTGGSDTATITIVVNDAAPVIAYSPSTYTLTKGTAMSTASPTSGGGTVVTWAISPTLPAGLTFDTSNGEISGTPTTITSSTTYTITATNAGGSDTATMTIEVNDVAPSGITYTPNSFSLTKDTLMTTSTPTSSGGTVISWSISPTLPAGLAFSTSTGAISGTPTSISSSTTYTVTATNSGGSATATVTIEVNVAAPTVTYSTSSLTLAKGVAMTSITPTTGGGAVVSWSISPALPSGLSFSTSNGAISGTPTAVSSSTAYTITATNAGGSGTATVTIQVNDIAPSGITYSPSFLSLAKDAAMSTATPTSSGGTVTSWSITPTLPSGLAFDTSTGAISGTPTATSSATTYTVTASNSGGSATVTVTILVNDAAPTSVTYSPNSFTLTKNVAMTSVTPTASGGTATSWSISPSLPAGLTLDTSSGAISGTPTAVSSSTVYTVTASNAGGSSTATVTIQVNDVAPYSVSYSGTPFTLTKGTAMTAVTPSASGGAVDTWSISPTLPAGLSLDTSTGKISGTPTAISSSTTYTITATNTGGSSTASVTITVNDVAPSIAYSGSPFTLTKGNAISTVAPTTSGGSVTTWSISPTLPAGLTFDTSNGEISGTPTAITSSATYTITATNTGGSDTATITIVVNDAAPVISYSQNSYTLTKGTAMTAATPSASGGTVVTWTISPTLPVGLSFDTSNGEISGTPTTITSSTTYTITATNTGGSDTATVSIEVNDVAPSGITYNPNAFTLAKGSAMTTTTPSSSGGTVVTWSISPTLPAGLSLDTSTGALSGTPTVTSSYTTYTVTATNSGGSSTATVTIQISDAAPSSINYNGNPFTLTKGVAMTSVTPTAGGGTVTAWSITPLLPTGLSFDSSTGAISGTPSVVTSSTAYTVTATNAGGSATATVTIQVNDIAPTSIAYSPTFLTLTKGSAMNAATPSSTGGTVTSWSISPSLPSGLSFSATTGIISGTPSTVSSATTYTVTGTNSGGGATATITILVNDAAPSSVTYSPNSFTLTKDVAMTSVTPTASGGTVSSWAISPTLPAGLSFDTSDGTISGTPTAVTSSTTYTVTATNAGGSGTATVTIQVNDVPPYSVSYSGTPFTLTKGTAMTAVTPSASGGAVDSWSVSPTLPSGLTLDSSTGVLSGTPTAIASTTTYTITATNTGGSSTVSVSITVNDAAPVIAYSGSPFTLTKGTAMTTAAPTSSGGTVISWSVSPTLPAGLSFDTSNGEISGTPTAITSSATYTVTASNTGGSDTATITIVVNDALPVIAYSLTLTP